MSEYDFELASLTKRNNLTAWTRSIGAGNLRCLRELSLRIPDQAVENAQRSLRLRQLYPHKLLNLRYLIYAGVSVDERRFLTPASNQMLQEHVRPAQETAKDLKLEGGILLQILMADLNIWGKLEIII